MHNISNINGFYHIHSQVSPNKETF